MGTVGLSFGSPTSGTGFDVSSTVAEIVGNLQNVETPWKTQLTTLESQDTAISSLGTLFSNLSNDMSSLTDLQGILAQKEGSSSDTSVLELTAASSSATAGTHTVVVNNLAQTSSGYVDAVTNSSDALSGSIAIQVGNGTTETVVIGAAQGSPAANTIYTGSGINSLAGLSSAINGANLGVTANVLADASGSRLSLVSGTSGAAGQMNITSSLTDANLETTANPTGALNYNSTVTGKDASLVIDGVPLSSASNTVSNLIPGVTFQLLAPSAEESDSTLEPVQVVISNDNTDVESTVNQMVSDYNSLISAVNTQEGNTSSGTPEPLFGSPTLSLLQEQLLSGLNAQNPNGYLDSISASNGTTLSGSMTIATGSGQTETIKIGSAPSQGAAANTIYTGSGSDYNTLAGLAAAINSADSNTSVASTASSDGTSGTITASSSAQLSGTFTIATDTGSTQTIYLGSSDDAPTDDLATGTSNNTLSSLESFISSNASTFGVSNVAINSNGDGTSTLSLSSSDGNALTVTSNLDIPGLGVTAAVATSGGESTLALTSQTAGSSGALTVTSAIVAGTPTALNFTDAGYSGTTADSGTLGTVANAGDTLSGSITIQVGGGTTGNIVIGAGTSSGNTIYTGSGADTLSDLMNAIKNANLGVSAALNGAGTGLTLTSSAAGAAGALAVTSNLVDTTNPTNTTLNYNASSDINNLTSLGISVNNDGSLTFDANSLDSVLNTDYSGVVGFFQDANGWGQTFTNTLNDAGTGSSTGILALAQSSNSSTESTLNAEISKEQSYISAQQTSLTAELNSANEIMQQLPSQLDGVNELYSAITGYDQNMDG
jgi:flagellar hook-associated protein 2